MSHKKPHNKADHTAGSKTDDAKAPADVFAADLARNSSGKRSTSMEQLVAADAKPTAQPEGPGGEPPRSDAQPARAQEEEALGVATPAAGLLPPPIRGVTPVLSSHSPPRPGRVPHASVPQPAAAHESRRRADTSRCRDGGRRRLRESRHDGAALGAGANDTERRGRRRARRGRPQLVVDRPERR